ncbi:MAG TPA: hypothetical protein DEV98_05495 [Clostridiales bacterium]|nr:hypothetical protein [Clostridiales bacterium]
MKVLQVCIHQIFVDFFGKTKSKRIGFGRDKPFFRCKRIDGATDFWGRKMVFRGTIFLCVLKNEHLTGEKSACSLLTFQQVCSILTQSLLNFQPAEGSRI